MTTGLRFTRQVRLAEVGESGQTRLSGVVVQPLGQGLGARVEGRYLAGAGVNVGPVSATTDAPGALPFLRELHPAAREVASGAYEALGVIRSILEATPHARVKAK